MDMRTPLGLVLTLLVAASPAAAQPQPAHRGAPPPARIEIPSDGLTLPMKDFGGRPVVEVRINDKGPFPFVLDTGATITVVGEEINGELSLSSPGGVHAVSPGGGAAPMIVSVGSLKLGTATIGDFMAAVMPMGDVFNGDSAPKGVLAASSFPGYLVTFDYPGKRITIKKGSLDAADAKTVFEYGEDEALPVVPVKIAGHVTHVHLDTGAAFALTLPMHFLTELPLKTKPKDAGQSRLLTGSFPVSAAAVDGAIEIGRYTIDVPEVRFSDVRHGPELGPGNIGYAILKDFVVTFDSKNRRVRLTR